MPTGDLIGSGRSADVFALDDEWVLRRYRDGQTTAAEVAVMAHLHAHGYPVPEVRPVDPTAPHDMVLRRLSGPTMVEAAAAGQIGIEESGSLLADLLARLHAVPAGPGAEPGASILHLDFHPLNVMLTGDGPMVIDWGNTAPGRPALDWALSALILAQVAVSGDELAPLAEVLLRAFLLRLPAGIVLDAAEMGTARARREADPNQSPEELRQLDEAVALVVAVAVAAA